MKVVLALSGGLDSATALYHAIANGATHITAVTLQYGGLHEEAETQAARGLIKYVRHQFSEIPIQHEFFSLPSKLFEGSNSALMGEISMPEASYQDIEETVPGPSITVVPFRNANILSICTAIAARSVFDFVYTAVHATDHGSWAYPDCTPEFMGAMANAIYVGTYHQVRLRTPFISMTKAEVTGEAIRLGVPLHLTWSCYQPLRTDPDTLVSCGTCPTCIERIKAFDERQMKDPIAYAIPINWSF